MFKQKIIRACTVPQSLGFVTGMLPDLQKKYEVVLLSSFGLEWEEVRRLHPDVKCIEVDMELKLHGSSIWNFIGTFFKNIFNGCRDYVNMVPDKITLVTSQC